MFIVIEQVGLAIIRDVEIGPAIVVIVCPDRLQAVVMVWIVNASLLGNIFKGAVATIAEQVVGFSWKSAGSTLHHDSSIPAELIVAAKFRQMVDINENVSWDK